MVLKSNNLKIYFGLIIASSAVTSVGVWGLLGATSMAWLLVLSTESAVQEYSEILTIDNKKSWVEILVFIKNHF